VPAVVAIAAFVGIATALARLAVAKRELDAPADVFRRAMDARWELARANPSGRS
jgi:hypothetical protein